MILYILGNGSHPDENNIFSNWQKGSISKTGLKPSIQPQYMANLNL